MKDFVIDFFGNNWLFIIIYIFTSLFSFNVSRLSQTIYGGTNNNTNLVSVISNLFKYAALIIFAINTHWYYAVILIPIAFILGELFNFILRMKLSTSRDCLLAIIFSVTSLVLQIIKLF